MKKSQEYPLRAKCGNLDVLCGIKDYTFNDGPARGIRAFDLKNGKGLEMTVAADRGLDIPFLSYKGVNLALPNKVGLRSPALYTENGTIGFLRQFFGGALTTCGLTYAGSPCEENGRALGLHGMADNTPASGVRAYADYVGDDKVLCVEGEVRQAVVFEENVVLKRKLTMDTERNAINISDVVENQGFGTEPVMLVYHINFGYPLLDAGARLYFSTKNVEPRNEFARKMQDIYDLIEEPEVGRDEQCYFHTGNDTDEGFAMIHNEKLGLAAVVRYDAKAFPQVCEWKCMRAGEYCLGLEPTTAGVLSRTDARESGMLGFLKPGESKAFNVTIEILDDPAAIAAQIAKA